MANDTKYEVTVTVIVFADSQAEAIAVVEGRVAIKPAHTDKHAAFITSCESKRVK